MKLTRLGLFTPWKLANATSQGTPSPYCLRKLTVHCFQPHHWKVLNTWSAHLLSAGPTYWLGEQRGGQGSVRDQDCSQVLKVLPPSIHCDPCLSLEGFSTCQQADSFIQKGGVWSFFYIWKYVLHEVNVAIFATGIFFPLRLCEYFETGFTT